jgi:hypothetical protein
MTQLGQLLFEVRATQKENGRTDGWTEGRTCQQFGFICFFFDLYVAFSAHKPVKIPHKPVGLRDFLPFLT